jgi:Ser/Thr protein kinase RdoA (MazF antagonist)
VTATDPSHPDLAPLAARAAALHGFGAEASVDAFSRTENPTFRVAADGRAPIALRIYRPGGRPAAEIRSELAWMTAARDEAGVPTPGVVAALDGDALVDVGAPGAPVYAVAFTLAPGQEAADDDLPALMPRLGALTAMLHRHARAWAAPDWFTRPRWDLATTLGDAPHWGPWQAGVPDPEQRAQLERAAAVLVRRLARFGVDPARFGLMHADLRTANVLIHGDELTLIDFDDAGFSWYLYDLGATLTLNEHRPDVDDLIAAWVDGYRTIEPLPVEDEREIPTFVLLRRLLVSAFAGSRDDTELAAGVRASGYDEGSCAMAEAYLSRFG